jgi:hypothetical protein
MQKLLGLLAILIVFGPSARAQDSTVPEAQKEPEKKQEAPKQETKQEAKPEATLQVEKPEQYTPKWELGAGYTYRSFYPPSAPRFSMNGANGTLVYNWKHWLSFMADATGTFKNQGVNGKTSIYTLMIGPRFYPFGHRHRLIPYGHFLYGAGGEILNIPAEGGFPQTTFTSVAKGWALGGGLEVRYKQHWVIQLIEFDYEKTYFEDFSKTVLSPTESNRRLSAAIVYRWGKAK